MQPRWDETTLRVATLCLGISALVVGALAFLRAGIVNPFEVQIFRHLLLFQDYYALAPFMAIAAAALYPPFGKAGERAAAFCGRNVRTVALATAAVLALGTHAVYHLHPLALDEYAVVFQAKLFAEGHLTAHFPLPLVDWLIPRFLQGRFLQVYGDGQVVSLYWPGFSALLSPFAALGMPWLLNPLISGATILVLHRLALRLFEDRQAAGYVVLFTLASPVIAINGMSYYSMPAHLLANALYMLLMVRPSPRRAFVAGLVGSIALVLHNPVPHLLFALPWIAWLFFQPQRLRLIASLAAGYLPVCLAVGWGWPFFMRHLASGGGAADVVTPAVATKLFMQRLGSMLSLSSATALGVHLLHLVKIWLWAMPGLMVVAAAGFWQARKDRGVWLALAGSVLLTYFGYFLVRFDQGHGWGSRYFHSAWLALPLFAVAAMRKSAGRDFSPRQKDPGAPSLPGYLAACALLSLFVLNGFRALQVEHFISRQLSQIPSAAAGEARVVILNVRAGYYAWDLVQNDPLLDNRPLILGSRGMHEDRAMMAARFPQFTLLAQDRRGSVWGLPARQGGGPSIARTPDDHREKE